MYGSLDILRHAPIVFAEHYVVPETREPYRIRNILLTQEKATHRFLIDLRVNSQLWMTLWAADQH
jgi:hypothetical protein